MHVIEKLIKLADAHQQADEYVAGRYWDADRHRGCSVGCTVEDAKRLGVLNGVSHDDHAALARVTGLPELAWRLADTVFEGLPSNLRPGWTPRFLRAAVPGADYSRWPARIMARLGEKLAEASIRDDVRQVALTTAGLWTRRANGDEPSEKEWIAAWEQAYAAWEQAYAAWEQADAAWGQADAAWEQADAACEQWIQWLADVVCDELAKGY